MMLIDSIENYLAVLVLKVFGTMGLRHYDGTPKVMHPRCGNCLPRSHMVTRL